MGNINLPNRWVWTRLGDIGIINPKHNGDNIGNDTEVTFLPMRCVEELTGLFDLSMTKRFSEVKKGYTPFINGDLIFAKITPCMENGKVAIVQGLKNGMGFGSTEFHVIRLPEFFPRKFFFYFLIQEELRKDAQRNMTGSAGQLRVPTSYMQQIPIPLPPLPEQRRIVAKIEEPFTRLDAGVSALQKTQAQLKRYRQSVLKAACEGKLVPTEAELAKAEGRTYEPADVLLARILNERREKSKGAKYKEPAAPDARELPTVPEGWCWATIGAISEIIMGQSPPGESYNITGAGVPLINGPVEFGPNPFSKTIKAKYTTAPTKMCKEDDLILCVRGSTTGRMNIAGFDACIGRGVAAIRGFIDQWYLNYYIHFNEKNFLDMGIGSTFPNISSNQVAEYLIPLPPLAEQRRIVAEVERRLSIADGVAKTVEQSLAQAERLRQSILKKAFEGRLVAQDANDEPASVLLEKIRLQKQLEIKKGKRNSSMRWGKPQTP